MPNIKVVVEKTDTGFSAFSEAHSTYTTGASLTELRSNIAEAINFQLKEEGTTIKSKQISLEIDLAQFFKYYKVLNARFLAERIGMNPSLLSQYVNGKKEPSSKQKAKILKGINEIGRELTEIGLTV